MDIYVGNLAYEVTSDQLRSAFAVHGNVVTATVITDRETGRSKGFGFVKMSDPEQAKAAIVAMHEVPLAGRPVRVNAAKPKINRAN